MKRNVIHTIVFLVVILSLGIRLEPLPINASEDKINYSELLTRVNQGMEETSIDLYEDEYIKTLQFEEKSEVMIDLRDDLNTIKTSVSQPITIYEVVVTRTYDIKDSAEKIDRTSGQYSTYETRAITTVRTYNGSTTTVSSIIGYYMYSNVMVQDVSCDAFKLIFSNISFSSNGNGNVSLIRARHHQQGVKYSSGPYTVVFDGNLYNDHRTYKTFSLYDVNGNANWSRYTPTYSALPRPIYSPGFIGSFYEVFFTWNLGGGGNYGWDSIERTNGFGTLPS